MRNNLELRRVVKILKGYGIIYVTGRGRHPKFYDPETKKSYPIKSHGKKTLILAYALNDLIDKEKKSLLSFAYLCALFIISIKLTSSMILFGGCILFATYFFSRKIYNFLKIFQNIKLHQSQLMLCVSFPLDSYHGHQS